MPLRALTHPYMPLHALMRHYAPLRALTRPLEVTDWLRVPTTAN